MATSGNKSIQLRTPKAKATYTGLYAYSNGFVEACADPLQNIQTEFSLISENIIHIKTLGQPFLSGPGPYYAFKPYYISRQTSFWLLLLLNMPKEFSCFTFRY